MEVNEAFLLEALDSLKREIFASLHCFMPGNILAYDPEMGLASVQPALRRKDSSGRILTAPLLREVPVFLPAADFEVSAGAPCLLLFADFCLDGWLASGQPGIPASPRAHDWSDAVALVGFFPALAPDAASGS